ncbi:MAG: pyruvate formate-lyase-activating protein [Acholeplasmataceae bacterium]|jgi:pyruvate formate lyase activating enzyme
MRESLNKKAYIHAIETFGTVDGPGVRYVLFLQGCPFRCKYCHNRDSWKPNIREQKSVKEILDDYNKYKQFYINGGLTVSGGEPLMQLDFLTNLFKEAKKLGIHTALDTSGGTFNSSREKEFLELLKYTDLVMLDLKLMDDEKHKWLTGHSNKNILEFAKFVDNQNVDLYIRHVVIPEINDEEKFYKPLREFLDTLHNVKKIELLKYHNLGIEKWAKIGFVYELPHIRPATQSDIDKASKIILDGYKFKI